MGAMGQLPHSWRSHCRPGSGSPGVVPRPASASAAAGNLLQTHLRVHPRRLDSETLGWGPAVRINKPRGSRCRLTFTLQGQGQRSTIPARAQARKRETRFKSRSHLLAQLDTCHSPRGPPWAHLYCEGVPAPFRLSRFRHLPYPWLLSLKVDYPWAFFSL